MVVVALEDPARDRLADLDSSLEVAYSHRTGLAQEDMFEGRGCHRWVRWVGSTVRRRGGLVEELEVLSWAEARRGLRILHCRPYLKGEGGVEVIGGGSDALKLVRSSR